MDLPAGRIRLRHGGQGPALLLLHGSLQTHAMWHAVAPPLARHFTVYCPDLRGYGGSFKPAPSADHAAFAKTEMAADMLALMEHFGHDRFSVAGQDRGARVAYRLAMDAPGRVEKLALLELVPWREPAEREGMAHALPFYKQFWFSNPNVFPDELTSKMPGTWFTTRTSAAPQLRGWVHPLALADYLEAAGDPATIEAMCEDFLADSGIDVAQERVARAEGKRVQCPVLVLWSAAGAIGGWYNPVTLWQDRADAPVTGASVAAGRYLAEEAPEDVLARLDAFLAGDVMADAAIGAEMCAAG